jgi:hypothetical protein
VTRRTRPPAGAAATGGATQVPLAWSAAIGAIAAIVYLGLCPPVTGDKDSAEFTLVLAFNGVAHPTGYPLFTLFGHLFVRALHAMGAPWAYAANAWSAVGGAVAILLLHRLALALIPSAVPPGRVARLLLASLPVALLAWNPIWTYEATLAEVYSWHVAWALGAALLFVGLTRFVAGEPNPPAARLLAGAAAWGVTCGLGGAHHATSIFVAAPLSLALLLVAALRRRLRAVHVAAVLLGACLPLLSYGIIAWRATHPAPIQWWGLAPGFQGLLWHVSGRLYSGSLGRFAPAPEHLRMLRSYVFPFLFPGLLVAAGAALRSRHLAERTIRWALVLSAALGATYAFLYGVVDPSSYLLQPLVFGLAALAPLLASFAATAPARRRAWAAGALAGLTALALWVPWLRTDRERTNLFVSFDRFVHGMWSAVPADTAIVFWTNDMYYKLRAYQMLEGEKPGLDVEHALLLHRREEARRFALRYGADPLEGLALDEAALRRAGHGDPYVTAVIDSVEQRVNRMTTVPVFHFDPEKPTLRLLLKPGAVPPSATVGPGGAAGTGGAPFGTGPAGR